jgi:hypothetical protein
MTQIPGHAVSQGSFELCPDEFIRIEFRGVAWETMGVKPRVFTEELLDQGCLVGSAVIPQEDHGATQVPEQLCEKTSHFWEADIFIAMESGIESNAPAFRGDADRRDGRDFGPSSSTAETGSLSPWPPGAGNVGDQKEAAFIKKRQVGPKSFGFFLYEATDTASSDGWLPRPVPWPFSLASGSSIPDQSSASTGWPWNSESQNVFRLPRPRAVASIDPWNSQREGAPAEESRQASPSLFGIKGRGVQGLAWAVTPAALLCGKPGTNAPRSLMRRPASSQCNDTFCRIRARRWPEAFAAPRSWVFHRVSCPIE